MTPAPTGTQIRLPCNLEAALKVTSVAQRRLAEAQRVVSEFSR